MTNATDRTCASLIEAPARREKPEDRARRTMAAGAILMCAARIATSSATRSLAAPEPVTLQALGKPFVGAKFQGLVPRRNGRLADDHRLGPNRFSGVPLTCTNSNTFSHQN